MPDIAFFAVSAELRFKTDVGFQEIVHIVIIILAVNLLVCKKKHPLCIRSV